LNQSQLAKATHVEPPTVVNKIDQLEKRGWLRRARSRTDRRTHTLFLTRRGQEILQQAKTNLDENERRLTRDLSADEKAMLFDLLRRIDMARD
ncbi:MAG: MarR family transcriptional regulator, partial [Gammaproteobacteria bacterium]|nr:MarR family transcriptional regulator [Gammaproteobacteria bacterium]